MLSPSSRAGTLTFYATPSSSAFPTFLSHFWNSLGIHPSHPRKHFILTTELFIPSWPMCDIMCLDIWTKVWMEGPPPLRSDGIRKQQSLGLQAQQEKQPGLSKAGWETAQCHSARRLWPQQVPKPSLLPARRRRWKFVSIFAIHHDHLDESNLAAQFIHFVTLRVKTFWPISLLIIVCLSRLSMASPCCKRWGWGPSGQVLPPYIPGTLSTETCIS